MATLILKTISGLLSSGTLDLLTFQFVLSSPLTSDHSISSYWFPLTAEPQWDLQGATNVSTCLGGSGEIWNLSASAMHIPGL